MDSSLAHLANPIMRSPEIRISQRYGENFPAIPYKVFHNQCKRLFKKLSEYGKPLCLKLNFNDIGHLGLIWEKSVYEFYVKSWQPSDQIFLEVDLLGNIISEHQLDILDFENGGMIEQTFAALISEHTNGLTVHFNRLFMTQFYDGLLMELLPIDGFNWSRVRSSEYHGTSSEYKRLLKDHFEHSIEHEQGTSHWLNKEQRILREKPEDIFRNSLWSFLDMFLTDVSEVQKEYTIDGTSNKVDIAFQNNNGDLYITEIKWLGKSKSNTSKPYGDERGREGARQTIDYIQLHGGVSKAIYLMYDGRHQNEDITWTSAELHPLMESIRFWLRSDSSSKRAKKKPK